MKRILLTLAFSISITGIAQSNSPLTANFNKLPQESIYAHTNNDFLLTGETLYYKIYCFDTNKNFSDYSKVAYIELINSDNVSVLKQKVNLKDGNGNGDFFINTDVKTGTYKLAAYTQWMQNKQAFFEKNIFIVNPFSDKLKSTVEGKSNSSVSSTIPSVNNTSINLFNGLQSSYGTRQKITLDFINNLNFDGKISISVKQKSNLNLPSGTNGKEVSTSNLVNKSNIYLPELRGSIIQGTVTSKTEGTKIPNVLLSLSLKGNHDYLPQTALTNDAGEFYFNMLDVDVDKISIQILDKERENYDIQLKEKGIVKTNFDDFPEMTVDQKTIDVIKNRSIYSQIENAFYTVKKDSILKTSKKDPLFNQIKKTYVLDDYKRFKTVRETFIEVIEGAGFVKRNDSYKISITDSDASETLNYLPSLLIIDGHIVYDHNDLIGYNSRKIKSISVVSDKYYYGNAIYQGIIIVDTFKKDFIANTKGTKDFTIQPVQPEKLYFFQQHETNNQRIPDYRTQLYWNPNLNLTQKQLSFYTSDVTGEFEIDAQGFTKDGKFVSVKKTFTVN
ncbi:hypothetical protein [Tenacibaculum amylolyticum]|uniref:hypothetical protein n=1 Tax=Tenacibaculum amylolyticum TaxID=104269 RepID=UPI0038949B13